MSRECLQTIIVCVRGEMRGGGGAGGAAGG
jgi:hypothetical protein